MEHQNHTMPNARRAVFKTPSLNQTFSESGFVVIKELVSNEGLVKLQNAFDSLGFDREPDSFCLSHWKKSLDQNAIHDSIVATLLPEINNYIIDYKAVLGTYAVKPGRGLASGQMEIHQDWSFVDERFFSPVSVWVALEDVPESHGCLEFFPGSHKIFTTVRGQNIKPPIEYLHNEMTDGFIKVPVQKGDAIVLSSRVVHQSGTNFSDRVRVAAMVAAIPKEAHVMAYERKDWDPLGTVRAYKCKDDFYPNYDITKPINTDDVTLFSDYGLVNSKEDAVSRYGQLVASQISILG